MTCTASTPAAGRAAISSTEIPPPGALLSAFRSTTILSLSAPLCVPPTTLSARTEQIAAGGSQGTHLGHLQAPIHELTPSHTRDSGARFEHLATKAPPGDPAEPVRRARAFFRPLEVPQIESYREDLHEDLRISKFGRRRGSRAEVEGQGAGGRRGAGEAWWGGVRGERQGEDRGGGGERRRAAGRLGRSVCARWHAHG